MGDWAVESNPSSQLTSGSIGKVTQDHVQIAVESSSLEELNNLSAQAVALFGSPWTVWLVFVRTGTWGYSPGVGLGFSFAEIRGIPDVPFLQPGGVPLSGHTAIWCVSLSSQFCNSGAFFFASGGFGPCSPSIGAVHVVVFAVKAQSFSYLFVCCNTSWIVLTLRRCKS